MGRNEILLRQIRSFRLLALSGMYGMLWLIAAHYTEGHGPLHASTAQYSRLPVLINTNWGGDQWTFVAQGIPAGIKGIGFSCWVLWFLMPLHHPHVPPLLPVEKSAGFVTSSTLPWCCTIWSSINVMRPVKLLLHLLHNYFHDSSNCTKSAQQNVDTPNKIKHPIK